MNLEMNPFENEFRTRFRNTSQKISPTTNGRDFIISNDQASRALLVRTEFPGTDEDAMEYTRYPAPHYNAETTVLFRFTIDDRVYPPDIIVLMYEIPRLKKFSFLIFRRDKLKSLLEKVTVKPVRSGSYRLLLWIFPENRVFVANNISVEGEWYLLGSGLWEGSERDFSSFVNSWNSIS